MTSSQDKAFLKPKLRSFSDAKTDRNTLKVDTVTPGIIITRQKPSAREKKAVYEK